MNTIFFYCALHNLGSCGGWDLRNEPTIHLEEKEARISYIPEKLQLSSDTCI